MKPDHMPALPPLPYAIDVDEDEWWDGEWWERYWWKAPHDAVETPRGTTFVNVHIYLVEWPYYELVW